VRQVHHLLVPRAKLVQTLTICHCERRNVTECSRAFAPIHVVRRIHAYKYTYTAHTPTRHRLTYVYHRQSKPSLHTPHTVGEIRVSRTASSVSVHEQHSCLQPSNSPTVWCERGALIFLGPSCSAR
jgi:hypothetical protein